MLTLRKLFGSQFCHTQKPNILTLMKRSHTILLLWSLYVAFAARVLGQILVATGAAPWLPPFEQWQSGIIPYQLLLVLQVVILLLFAKVAMDFTFESGFFAQPHPRLQPHLQKFGQTYLSGMVARYALVNLLLPDMRQLAPLIPTIFHVVLATFILCYAYSNRTATSVGAEPNLTAV
jgi:uncharacterized protein